MARMINPVRQAARLAGEKHYHGSPCGINPEHGTLRYVSTWACVECNRQRNRDERARLAQLEAVVREHGLKV